LLLFALSEKQQIADTLVRIVNDTLEHVLEMDQHPSDSGSFEKIGVVFYRPR
jgi:hypothetical protein